MTDVADRLSAAVLASLELAAVALGDRLGWYADLDRSGPSTAGELAARTGTDERYAREWLEQQAVAGYLGVDDVSADPSARRYALATDDRGALVDPLDEGHLVPFARMVAGLVRTLPELADVVRGRRTLGWSDFGDDVREAQAAGNRPWFLGSMPHQLATVPGVDAALRAGGRVADVGCGFGWSSIGIARAWPAARVDAFDVDPPSVAAARRHVAEAGLADRVRVRDDDVTTTTDDGFALVTAFECVHDLPDPVRVLAAMGRLAAPTGTVVVVDEKVAEVFTAPGDEVDRLMYGFSVLCCLPDGCSGTGPSAATGTVMRPATLEAYARAAGFAGVEVLDWEHDTLRAYRLLR